MTAEAGRDPARRPSRKAAARRALPKSEVTRRRILDAAAKVFAKNGYQLTHLREIAAECGIHVTALGYHFDTKEDLVEEMMNRLVTTVHRTVTASVGDAGGGRDRIRAAAVAYLQAILPEQEYMAAHDRVLYQVPEAVRERHFALLKAHAAFWRELVQAAADAGELRPGLDPSLVTQTLFGALTWTREWYRPGRKTPEEIAAGIVDMMFGGIGAA